jgi:hypothetical protein
MHTCAIIVLLCVSLFSEIVNSTTSEEFRDSQLLLLAKVLPPLRVECLVLSDEVVYNTRVFPSSDNNWHPSDWIVERYNVSYWDMVYIVDRYDVSDWGTVWAEWRAERDAWIEEIRMNNDIATIFYQPADRESCGGYLDSLPSLYERGVRPGQLDDGSGNTANFAED